MVWAGLDHWKKHPGREGLIRLRISPEGMTSTLAVPFGDSPGPSREESTLWRVWYVSRLEQPQLLGEGVSLRAPGDQCRVVPGREAVETWVLNSEKLSILVPIFLLKQRGPTPSCSQHLERINHCFSSECQVFIGYLYFIFFLKKLDSNQQGVCMFYREG